MWIFTSIDLEKSIKKKYQYDDDDDGEGADAEAVQQRKDNFYNVDFGAHFYACCAPFQSIKYSCSLIDFILSD